MFVRLRVPLWFQGPTIFKATFVLLLVLEHGRF